jgi:hypothetical protein
MGIILSGLLEHGFKGQGLLSGIKNKTSVPLIQKITISFNLE